MTSLTAIRLRTVADPDIRQIIIDGLSAVAAQFGQPGMTLGKGVVAVLRAIATPLGNLIARAIPDAQLKTLVATAVTRLINTLANEQTVSRMMSNPAGYLGYLAGELVDAIKEPLADYLARRSEERRVGKEGRVR